MADAVRPYAPKAPRADRRAQVIVPAKRLSDAKSRLRPFLDSPEREDLVLRMLCAVIEAADAAEMVADVFVVTRDPVVAAAAAARGAAVVPDRGEDLNDSLRRAMQDPRLAKGSAWLVLPGDLPDVTSEAVDHLLTAIDSQHQLVVVPDQHGTGTNALGWRGAPFAGFRFGPSSFAAHRMSAEAAGFAVIARAPEPAFHDLDDLPGLERLCASRNRLISDPSIRERQPDA